MDYKRRPQRKRTPKRSVPVISYQGKILLGGLGCIIVLGLGIFGVDSFVNPEMKEVSMQFVNDQHTKHLVVAKSEQMTTPEETGGDKGGSSVGASLDKVGNYSIDYYVMFPLYEGTLFQMNGDWDDDGNFDGGAGDGGFGPVQETHSGLGNTVDTMYDSDPEFFEFLRPYVDNPLLYLKSCQGNDHANHDWEKCRTYWDGTAKLRQIFLDNLRTPQDIKKYYDAYMIIPEKEYLEPAIKQLSSITGKSQNELGPGTIAALFAVYVRYSPKPWATEGLTADMTEDEIIDKISDNAYARASKNDKPRFLCQRSVAKAMNRGEIDIYGYYTCDGSCGGSHGTPSGKSFGELFGKE